MNFFSILLFILSSNIDNLVVGVSYGIKKIYISLIPNILIASITCIGTILSMLFGQSMSYFIPAIVSNTIGGLILIGIGTAGILKYLCRKKKNEPSDGIRWPLEHPEKYDQNNNKQLDWRESILLGLALSINNIGLGIGASIAGISILPAAIGSFIMSILLLFIGNLMGSRFFLKSQGNHTELLSGFIIIALGILVIIF